MGFHVIKLQALLAWVRHGGRKHNPCFGLSICSSFSEMNSLVWMSVFLAGEVLVVLPELSQIVAFEI